MKILIMYVLIVVLFISFSFAQTAPDILWTKSFKNVWADYVRQTHDDGLIILGDPIIRCDQRGDTLWTLYTHLYGPYECCSFNSIRETSDHGYILGGTGKEHRGRECFDENPIIHKINSDGDSLWFSKLNDRVFGSTDWIEETFDRGYISINRDWTIRYTEFGDTLWTNKYGGRCIQPRHQVKREAF